MNWKLGPLHKKWDSFLFCPIPCNWILGQNMRKKGLNILLSLCAQMSSNFQVLPNSQYFIHILFYLWLSVPVYILYKTSKHFTSHSSQRKYYANSCWAQVSSWHYTDMPHYHKRKQFWDEGMWTIWRFSLLKHQSCAGAFLSVLNEWKALIAVSVDSSSETGKTNIGSSPKQMWGYYLSFGKH